MVLKNYASTPYGQTHYRRHGSGHPVVVLHASPMSSAFMVPLINALSESADVIAPDTPGYGNSDGLPQEVLNSSDDLQPYVEWLAQFLNAVNMDSITLYGSATGAQIAIEFAKVYPERVKRLILENAVHFEAEEVESVMENYFPSLSPKSDGSHLALAWDIARSVFQWFPWYQQDDEHRVSDREPPAAMMHATALAYLNAGEGYAEAYRRAFKNESADRLLPVMVPTSVIRWSGSIVREYVDRFDGYEFTDNFTMCYVEGGLEERYSALKEILSTE